MSLAELYELATLNPETGCLEWQGRKDKDGYGHTSYTGKQYGAHRIAYQLAYNVELASNQLVCHSCDNPPCINADHLFLGTHIDNMRDMVAKGRHASKLSERNVYEIQEMLRCGEKQNEIAQMFDVGHVTIHSIAIGKQWARLTGNTPNTFAHIYTNRGERKGSAKLTERDVRKIQEMLRRNERRNEIAQQFSIGKTAIHKIATGESWGWLTGNTPETFAYIGEGRGEYNGNAKLRESDVREIRWRAQRGECQTDLAREFDVSRTTIRYIVQGKTWTSVEMSNETREVA